MTRTRSLDRFHSYAECTSWNTPPYKGVLVVSFCVSRRSIPHNFVPLLPKTLLLVIGFAQPMMFIGGGTLRQAFSPPELIGRASVSITFMLIGVVPLGALLGGALGDAIGPRGALLVAGVGILLTPLWLLFSPVRSLRTVV